VRAAHLAMAGQKPIPDNASAAVVNALGERHADRHGQTLPQRCQTAAPMPFDAPNALYLLEACSTFNESCPGCHPLYSAGVMGRSWEDLPEKHHNFPQ
jgi:hypothetical protein